MLFFLTVSILLLLFDNFEFFLQNPPANSLILAAGLSVRQFQMPLGGLRFMKKLVAFGIIYSSQQAHVYKI